jgi:hypothetical protein
MPLQQRIELLRSLNSAADDFDPGEGTENESAVTVTTPMDEHAIAQRLNTGDAPNQAEHRTEPTLENGGVQSQFMPPRTALPFHVGDGETTSQNGLDYGDGAFDHVQGTDHAGSFQILRSLCVLQLAVGGAIIGDRVLAALSGTALAKRNPQIVLFMGVAMICMLTISSFASSDKGGVGYITKWVAPIMADIVIVVAIACIIGVAIVAVRGNTPDMQDDHYQME